MKYWKTQFGEKIAYKDLTNSHLINILKFIEKRAKEGVGVGVSMGFESDNDFQTYDVITISGEEVKKELDYYGLEKEAISRGLVSCQCKNLNN